MDKLLPILHKVIKLLLGLCLSTLGPSAGLSARSLLPSLLLSVRLVRGRLVVPLLLRGPHLLYGNCVGPVRKKIVFN